MPGIKRLTDKSGGVGIVYSGKDPEEVAYCHRCLKMANIRSKLGNRVYMPDEFGNVTIPPDYDLWRADDPRKMICHFCGTSQLHLSLKVYIDCRDKPDPLTF
jgi:hypothetical protein